MQVASPAHVRARASHIVTRSQPIVRAWRCQRARAALLLMAAGVVAGASGYVATAAMVGEPLEVRALALAMAGGVVSQDEPRQLMAAARARERAGSGELARAAHDRDHAEPVRTDGAARRPEMAATLAPRSRDANRSQRSTRQDAAGPTLAARAREAAHAKTASASRMDALTSQRELDRAGASKPLRTDGVVLRADAQAAQARRREQARAEIAKDEKASRVAGSAAAASSPPSAAANDAFAIVRQSDPPPSAASARVAVATSMSMVATGQVASDRSETTSTKPSGANDTPHGLVESIARPATPTKTAPAAPPATATPPPSAAGTQTRALQHLEPHVHNLIVRGSLPSASVRRALARLQPELGSCQNARADSAIVIASSWHTRTAIDEAGRTRDLEVTGPDAARAVSTCLAHATSKLVVAAPDTGRVNASWDLRFEPVQ